MRIHQIVTACVMSICAGFAVCAAAQAKAPQEKIAELGGSRLTCMGAERAGSVSGIAEYTGKYLGTWPGQKNPFGYEPGPYAGEKPLFTITAQNMDKYADKLNEGQKALLKKYPQNYRMNIYPSHRDFRFADWVCDTVKKNAATAEIVHDGLGVSGISGAIPFPFPTSGLEAIWNIIKPHFSWSDSVVHDIADVYANGSIAWGRNKLVTMTPGNNPDPAKRGSYQDPIGTYFYYGSFLPERDKGVLSVGFQPNDYQNNALQAWAYHPGTRRVRQAPEVGFDYPVPPAGLHSTDDDGLFNGSPERFSWKIIGKKELYIPYANFRINDPTIKYSELIKPNTVNPDYVRYELHRVWVIEGTSKPGIRHIYSKRILYADEDTWYSHWADNFDSRGQLWRVNFVTNFYSQESSTFQRGVTVYHDLTSGAYEATYLVNERGKDWWRLNVPVKAELFTPQAMARGGH